MELNTHGKICVQLMLFALGTAQASGKDSHQIFYEREIPLWSSFLHTGLGKLVSGDIETGIHSSEDIAEGLKKLKTYFEHQ